MSTTDEPERSLDRKISRRALFTGWRSAKVGGAVDAPLPASAPVAGAPEHIDTRGRPTPPTLAAITADHATMVNLGPRITGSTAHNDFIGWLKEEFERAGCYERSSIDHAETAWIPRAWGLQILSGPEAGDVPVASFRARSGGFEPDGTARDAPATGPMLYLGTAPLPEEGRLDLGSTAREGAAFEEWYRAQLARLGPRADGAIVVIDLVAPTATLETVASLAGCYHAQTPEHASWPAWAQHRPWNKLWMLPRVAVPPSDVGGPIGALFVVDASYDALAGQFLPPLGPAGTLPTLLLDRDAGARVRRATSAETKPRATLTLSATNLATTAPSIVFKLAGGAEETLRGPSQDLDDALADAIEYLVINTHSDGVSIAQENGCLAMINLARHAGALKRRGRGMRRTLVFSVVTGRMGSDRSPQTSGFLEAHPRIAARTAFGMTPEHLGCSEWADDPTQGFRATGFPEPTVITHHEGLTPLIYGSYIERPLVNHGVSNGGGITLGVGGPLAVLAPSVSIVSGPTYLHQAGPDFVTGGRLDQFDAEVCARQYGLLTDILAGFENLPFRGRGVFAPLA